MRQLYWCDKCFKDVVDENDSINRIYFSCYSNQQWASHLKSKKHIKFCKLVEEDDEKVLCKHCNKDFTNEGYEIHKERNNKLWDLQNRGGYKHLKCNNFFTKAKRYENLDDYIAGTDPNKPKLKRTKVGKISPITCTVREPNKNKIGYNKSNAQSHNEPIDDLIICKTCDKVLINDSNYTDKQLKDYFNKDMCDCTNAPIIEKKEPIKPTKQNPLICERKKDGIQMNIDEIDTTERPTYYDNCLYCGKGIIEIGLTKNIYINWEMDYCDCDETDEHTDSASETDEDEHEKII